MTRISPEIDLQIARYADGPAELRAAIGHLSSDQVRQQAAPEDVIFITGSLFLVGAARHFLVQ